MELARSLTIEVLLCQMDLVPLSLKPRKVMHGAAEQSLLMDRVSLGRPRVDPLDPDKVTAIAGDLIGLHASGHAESFRFCLLTIEIGFRHEPSEPVVQATLSVRLFNEPPNGYPEPVAIAMIPELAVRAVKRSSTIKLGANLHFVNSEIGMSVERESGDPYLYAHKPGRDDPAWFFNRTRHQELVGPHQLLMVIAMPPHGHSRAQVDLSANIRRRRSGLIGYEAQMPPDFQRVNLT